MLLVTLNPPPAKTEFDRRECGGAGPCEGVEDIGTAKTDGGEKPLPESGGFGEGVTEKAGFCVGTAGEDGGFLMRD